ncbi:hypothetical protein Pan44_26340 [Caulifigura coniformis]|uniref:Uncharacterized protein n=1 Tax=Caulifigura coniformis TaxID=2527983 RepID=A0A517SER4_9PLAN|nr:hypothetical protein [Caulifigura coniformis]QDT54600.1 hypothetical protein Pan44_26340 [Caulifigura coniformis]
MVLQNWLGSLAFLVLFLASPLVAHAQPAASTKPSTAVQALLRQSQLETRARVQSAQAAVRATKGPAKKALAEQLSQLQKKQAIVVAEMNSKELGVGSLGGLSKAGVFQVIDKNNVLIDWLDRDVPGGQKETFWLRGVDTASMANGKEVELQGCFHIAETTTYRNVGGGTKTIFVIEPFDLSPYVGEKTVVLSKWRVD